MFRFEKPNRPVNRVFLHCSASDNPDHDSVDVIDRWHRERGWSGCGYHFFIRKSGLIEIGRSLEKTPAAQAGNNRGTIAICLHGLKLEGFTIAQFEALQRLCYQIDHAFEEGVTFHGHNEVAAKACPVFDYRAVLSLYGAGYIGKYDDAEITLGDHVDLYGIEEPEAGTVSDAVLRFGDSGPLVRSLQGLLKGLGYQVGVIDGEFGPLLRSAVVAFQFDNHLVGDGIAGRATFEAMEDAQERKLNPSRQTKTVMGLAAGGSRIAEASVASGSLGTVLSLGGGVAVLEEATGAVTELTNQAKTFQGMLENLGSLLGPAIFVIGVLVVLQAIKAARARRDDHRSGKTL